MGPNQGCWCLIHGRKILFNWTHEYCLHLVICCLRLWHTCLTAPSPVTNTVISSWLISGLSMLPFGCCRKASCVRKIWKLWYITNDSIRKFPCHQIAWELLCSTKAFFTERLGRVFTMLMTLVTFKMGIIYVSKPCLTMGFAQGGTQVVNMGVNGKRKMGMEEGRE